MSPDWKIILEPHKCIPHRKVDAFVVADLMADVLGGAPSDFGGYYVTGALQGQWGDWKKLGNGLTLSNCGFARFASDGTVHRSSAPMRSNQKQGQGFYALPSLVPLQASIGGATGGTSIGWGVQAGEFVQVPRTSPNGATALYNLGATTVERAVSTSAWPVNAPLLLDLSHLVSNPSGTRPEQVIELGPRLRLALRNQLPPALEVLRTTTSGGQRRSEWGVFKTLDSYGPFDPRDTGCKVALYHLGERLVWEMDGHAVWMLDSPDDPQSPDARKIEWGGLPLRVQNTNLRSTVEVTQLEFTGQDSTVTRRVPFVPQSGQEMTVARAGGSKPFGTKLNLSTNSGTDYTEYTVALETDPDNRTSPLCSQLILVYEPVYTTPSVTGAVDVTVAVTSCSVNKAHPPAQVGAEGQLDLDVELLRRFTSGWEAVVQDRCPIKIWARWRDSSGQPVGNYKPIMKGYLHGTTAEESGWNAGKLSFQFFDQMIRLKGSNALLDSGCWPADVGFWRKLGRLTQQQADTLGYYGPQSGGVRKPLSQREKLFYDGDAIKEIMRMILGSQEAETLNGGADPAAFVPPVHPPLLTAEVLEGSWLGYAARLQTTLTSASLEAQGGVYFPVPYGEDALTWINKFTQDFYTVFFCGYRDRSEFPIPLYGLYEYILGATAVLWQVDGLDLTRLESTTKPEEDYNEILVWTTPYGIDKAPNTPAVIQGRAKLPYSHPRSSYRTWPVKKAVESPYALGPDIAAASAGQILSELDGDKLRWPVYQMVHGDATMQPGDVFVTTAAQYLTLNEQWFRAGSVSHEYTRNESSGAEWTTKVDLYTMSLTQKQAFARSQNLPIPL